MTELPRLELTEDPNKKNDYIIFRYQIKGKKGKKTKKDKSSNISTKKRVHHRKKHGTKKIRKRGLFNFFL